MKEQKLIQQLKSEENYDNVIEISLKSKSENERLARNLVASVLVLKDPEIDELNDIKTAVSEAVTNSVVHGYKGKEGTIYLKIILKDNLFYIMIKDFGVGIKDIARAMQPFFTTGPENERSGMGFTVMESFMDEIVVSNQKEGTGLIVEMLKCLK